jgi:hypothetical protein
MGKAYDVKAVLNVDNVTGSDDPNDELKPIQFTVDVIDWVEAGEVILPEYKPTIVEDAAQLAAAFEKGGEILLANDITVPATIEVPAGVAVNLDLNGKTLTNKVENAATDVIVVAAGATLTINGEGTVEAVTGNDGYAVIADGTVIINGGTFKSGVDANGEANAVVYARGEGKVYVNGGTFPNDNTSKFVINKKDADRATAVIEVKGGKFQSFDPANNAAEGAGTNFVATGYKSVYDNATGYYTVVRE